MVRVHAGGVAVTVRELMEHLATFPADRVVVLEVTSDEGDSVTQGGILQIAEEHRCCAQPCVFISGNEKETTGLLDDDEYEASEATP